MSGGANPEVSGRSPKKDGRPSIRDVAEQAGVSVTTVSHVLNEMEGARVNEDTRRRVRTAARQLGYAPNRLARGLRLQRSNTLAMVSDHIATTPHAGRLILGAQETASTRGWTLMLFTTVGDPDTEERDVKALRAHQVDGVLYASMYHRVVRLPSGLDGLPVVLVDARTDDGGADAVVPDEVRGGREATEELIRHGHRRIGLPWNRDDIPATHGRLAGHREALAAAHLPFDPALVVPEESESGGGYLASRHLLARADRPTALFCFNDRMAMGAYRAAAEAGLRIPDDVSVIGFDNQPYIADGLYPGLTTMALPHYEMGVWAVERILELIERPGERGGRTGPHRLPCPLIRRASVGPSAARDPAAT
jgi:LacI family transcriptional regulator